MEREGHEAEIKAYYEKNKAQFDQQAAKRATHILFKTEDGDAKKVLAVVEGGGTSPSLLRSTVDTGIATKGGDLGWPTTPYVPEFQTALKKLDNGETAKLVKTPFGWHIIRVTDDA